MLTGIVASDRILIASTEFRAGQTAPYTVRVSPLQPSPLGMHGGAIAVARGETVDAQQAIFQQSRQPTGLGSMAAMFLAIAGMLLAWSGFLRSRHWGSQLRHQLVTLGSIILIAIILRTLFMLTSISILAAPVALVGLLVGNRASKSTAVASASLLALLVAAMVPFEIGVAAALLLQAAVPPLLTRRNAPLTHVLVALLAAGLASALAYALAYSAAWQTLPSLDQPLRSTWLAAFLGAALAGLLTVMLRPLFEWFCGEVSKRTLTNMERLSQPLLRQIASQAPGSWQHSLAMAKLSEGAGEAIGADIQLLRVGAYYHDLGKTTSPKYFIENLGGGESSVHENLKPSASRDAIFAHVSEGVRLATEAGLPSRVIDFIRSHHCAASLEYFWTMEQVQDPPSRASAQEFCYPGTRPQCRETGILAICDALEAATRNLKSPGIGEIEALVHHIVYGKLRAGQLDECGLSLAEVQTIDQALSLSLLQAHAHDAPRARGVDAVETRLDRPQAHATLEQAAPRLAELNAVRLDSLDLPKVGWQQNYKAQGPVAEAPGMAFVETEAMDHGTIIDEVDVGDEMDTEQEQISTTNYEGNKAKSIRSRLAVQLKNDDAASTDFLRTKERTAQSHPEERATMKKLALDSDVQDRLTAPRAAQPGDLEGRVTAPREAQEEAIEDRITAPQRAQDGAIEDRLTSPRQTNKLDAEARRTLKREAEESDVEERVTSQQSAQKKPASPSEDTPALAHGSRRSVQPVQGGETIDEEPLLLESPIRGQEKKQEEGKVTLLGQWRDALDVATGDESKREEDKAGPPVPPPVGSHGARETIPLGKDEIQLTPAPPTASRPSKRADSNDGMKPGEMVIGAPPATHPERTLPGVMPREEITAEHYAIPDEARRPEDRITEESPAVVPMDAFPETVSATGPRTDKSKRDEDV
jgi:putative nucleotidyltransferase with HDIG domain